VLFLPEGIVGTLTQKWRGWKKAPMAPFAAKARVGYHEEAQRVSPEAEETARTVGKE
jgi:hypothetical protein